jgi:hypothetical protein
MEHRLGNAGRACPVCPRQRAFFRCALVCAHARFRVSLVSLQARGGQRNPSCSLRLGLRAILAALPRQTGPSRVTRVHARASAPTGGLGRQALAARHLPLGERGWSRTRRRSHRGRCSALHPEPGSARESVQHPAPPCVARTWRGVAPLRPRESPLPSAYVLGVQTGLEASCV